MGKFSCLRAQAAIRDHNFDQIPLVLILGGTGYLSTASRSLLAQHTKRGLLQVKTRSIDPDWLREGPNRRCPQVTLSTNLGYFFRNLDVSYRAHLLWLSPYAFSPIIQFEMHAVVVSTKIGANLLQ